MFVGYKIKKIFAVIRKKYKKSLDVETTKLEDLSDNQIKAIMIAESCIKNNKSKLYFQSATSQIQIQLPSIFITITQLHGYYECDIVFVGDRNKTSDKIIFDRGGIKNIYNKFNKEVDRRMAKNIHTRDIVINTHLESILTILNEKNIEPVETNETLLRITN